MEGEYMLKIEEMCKIAYNLLEEDGLHGIYLIKDIGDSLVFYGGNPQEVYYGIRTVSVDKQTGESKWFNCNEFEELIHAGKELSVPNEYLYKAS